MHDVLTVAVVDAGEDLLHEDGCVTLSEFATLQNLIEKLTSLADPVKKDTYAINIKFEVGLRSIK